MYSLLPALVSGLFLGYGLYVLSSSGFSRISLSFLALCLASFGWQGTWAVLFQTTDPQLADRLIRAGYLVIIFLPTCLYHFVVAVLGLRSERRWLLVSYALALALAGLNLATDLFVAGHHHYFFGFYPQAGPLHWIHVVQAGVVVGRGIWLCHRTAQASAGERGRRTRLLGLALVIYLMAAVDYLCNYGIAMYPPGVGFIAASLVLMGITRFHLTTPVMVAAAVAHELRTPLANIGMKAKWLEDYLARVQGHARATDGQGGAGLSAQAMARSMTRQVERAQIVITLTLASSRMDGLDPATFTTQSVAACVLEAIESYPFRGTERQQIDILIERDFEFRGTDTLMIYVFYNLIRNALQAIANRKDGAIRIHIGRTQREGLIEVSDNGCGIPPEDLPYVFDAFFSTRGFHGAGLGLPFCRRVIDSFGGRIDCRSNLGTGTTFSIGLPTLHRRWQAQPT